MARLLRVLQAVLVGWPMTLTQLCSLFLFCRGMEGNQLVIHNVMTLSMKE